MAEADINKVKEVVELRLPPDDVNKYLQEGWILLAVLAEGTPSDSGNSQRAVYVVGRPGTE